VFEIRNIRKDLIIGKKTTFWPSEAEERRRDSGDWRGKIKGSYRMMKERTAVKGSRH